MQLFKKDKSVLGYISIFWIIFGVLFYFSLHSLYSFWFYIFISSVSSMAFSILYFITSKEEEKNEETTTTTDKYNSYTFGNYKSDIRLITELYKTAKTNNDIKKLLKVTNRVLNNMSHISFMGRNSFNGVILSNFYKTADILKTVNKYSSWKATGLNELKASMVLEISYHNEVIVGLTPVIKTAYQSEIRDIRLTRQSSFMKEKQIKSVLNRKRKEFKLVA